MLLSWMALALGEVLSRASEKKRYRNNIQPGETSGIVENRCSLLVLGVLIYICAAYRKTACGGTGREREREKEKERRKHIKEGASVEVV